MLNQAVAGLSPDISAEIAFFGGSFTALDEEYMTGLLAAAHPFVGRHGITGIRVSTRPDAISLPILHRLKQYGVTTVELGAQSTDDRVLQANHRGHTARQISQAASLVRDEGFALGLQMMTGLYRADEESDRQTARDLLAMKPDMVRIYPTVTLPGTGLYTLYTRGEYTPPTLEQTVALCSELLLLFESAGVPVIRLGLQGDPSAQGGIGPCHPALRELCEGEIYFQTIQGLLSGEGGTVTLFVHPTCRSKLVGQRKINLHRLTRLGWHCLVVEDPSLPPHTIGISRKENSYVPEIFGSTGLQIVSG